MLQSKTLKIKNLTKKFTFEIEVNADSNLCKQYRLWTKTGCLTALILCYSLSLYLQETALLITKPPSYFSRYLCFRFITSLLLWIGMMEFPLFHMLSSQIRQYLRVGNNKGFLLSDSRWCCQKQLCWARSWQKPSSYFGFREIVVTGIGQKTTYWTPRTCHDITAYCTITCLLICI